MAAAALVHTNISMNHDEDQTSNIHVCLYLVSKFWDKLQDIYNLEWESLGVKDAWILRILQDITLLGKTKSWLSYTNKYYLEIHCRTWVNELKVLLNSWDRIPWPVWTRPHSNSDIDSNWSRLVDLRETFTRRFSPSTCIPITAPFLKTRAAPLLPRTQLQVCSNLPALARSSVMALSHTKKMGEELWADTQTSKDVFG